MQPPHPESSCELNYLGHLCLSPADEDALLGSLLGDFVKGPLDHRYPPTVTRAIALHRKLDAFTDAHPIVQQSKSRISAGRRRYAGIMIDVFYDHFLSRHWPQFHDEPLASFSARVYAILRRRQHELPERLRTMAPYMIEGDWLGSYAQVDSIHAALNRMSRRLKRDNRLTGGGDELLANYSELESDFRAFLPHARQFSLKTMTELDIERRPGAR